MRHKWIAAAALTLGAIAMPAIALADNQPSEGENSTGRNEAGFGEGPHCHINVRANAPFTDVQAFPSHRGHQRSGLGQGPFVADPNCDGDAGN